MFALFLLPSTTNDKHHRPGSTTTVLSPVAIFVHYNHPKRLSVPWSSSRFHPNDAIRGTMKENLSYPWRLVRNGTLLLGRVLPSMARICSAFLLRKSRPVASYAAFWGGVKSSLLSVCGFRNVLSLDHRWPAAPS